ncbi:unnamed protein product [Dibothriocephalus latus]|uniref:Uncharacterized protein n=1 Tax=Dibothriocephalus latus TaxID=60516 RepID=A0A3P6V238_DIBLA|nr:unnamed protein product [Dibothriocephalus latus]
MDVILSVYPASVSSKDGSVQNQIKLNIKKERSGFFGKVIRILLVFNYLIGTFVSSVQFLRDSAIYTEDGHSLYHLCLWSSWLFLSIGFGICLCGFFCKCSRVAVDITPAALDAFFYGEGSPEDDLVSGYLKSEQRNNVLLGNIAVIQGLEDEATLVAPLKVLVFGLAGLLLIHIDSATSSKKVPDDSLVLMI